MKVTCSRTDLLEKIGIVENIILAGPESESADTALESNDSKPEMVKLYISAEKCLNIKATDGSSIVECPIDGEIGQNGVVSVNLAVLKDILSCLPGNEVIIETRPDKLIAIRYDKSCSIIKDFFMGSQPEFKSISDEAKSFQLAEKTLKELFYQVAFVVNSKKGYFIKVKDNTLMLYAANKHTIAYAQGNLNAKDINAGANVSHPTLNKVKRVLNNVDSAVNIVIDKSSIEFTNEKFKIWASLIDSGYLECITYKNNPRVIDIKVDTKLLLDACSRISVISENPETDILNFIVEGTRSSYDDFSNAKLKISCMCIDNNGTEIVNVQAKGSNFRKKYNYEYLLDALKVIKDVEIIVSFLDSPDACIIKPVSGEQFTYFVSSEKRNSLLPSDNSKVDRRE